MLKNVAAARAVRLLLCASTLALVFAGTPALRAQNQGQAQAAAPIVPNYDLASQWTSQRVSRLVFDTSVTPRWLETSDRFWYAYQTREGRRFYIVDPVKKAKAPLFDHAKMAAALTSITRIPYDAQHLPFTHRQLREERHRLRVQRPGAARADINTTKPPVITTEQHGGHARRRRRPGGGRRTAGAAGRRAGAAAATRGAAAQPDAPLRVRHGHGAGHAARGLQGRAAAAALGVALARRQDHRSSRATTTST